jgi:uncharacterized membrane protein
MKGGLVLGILLVVGTVGGLLLAMNYNQQLALEREQAIAQLVSMPEYANCRYDASTCPQAEDTAVLPDISAIGIAILGLAVGAYLIRHDQTNRKILEELVTKREQIASDEKRSLVLSVLTPDERKVVEAVRAQPGISQATLCLRTDMSKAKLSMMLKGLEERGIVARTENGKTNTVDMKINLG